MIVVGFASQLGIREQIRIANVGDVRNPRPAALLALFASSSTISSHSGNSRVGMTSLHGLHSEDLPGIVNTRAR